MPNILKTVKDENPNNPGITYYYDDGNSEFKKSNSIQENTNIPELNSGKNSVLYSSNSINDNIVSSGNQIQNAENDLISNIDYNKEINDILSKAKDINNFTADELTSIEEAGLAEAEKYNAEIKKAQEAKQYGMGLSEIGGGRMGGFMNTQIAGASALRSGVKDWAGAGGKLESIKSAYDSNISDLETKKTTAIEMAKQARKEYIRTGKTTALNAVRDALTAAQTINNQIISNQKAKQDMIIAAAQEARNKAAEERTSKSYTETEAGTSISNMALAGTPSSQIDQNTKNEYEKTLGLATGTFDKFYEDILNATQFSQEGRYADFAKKINDIVKEIPKGQTITINGKTYNGTGESKSTELPTSAQEYEYYASQEIASGRTPISYDEYQNKDANRKALASSIANSSGMTPAQQAQFLNITNNYQKDALVQAYDKGQGLNAIADQVLANPNSATNQLKSLYILVKNLDPDSAVREGEIALASKTASYLDNFKTTLTRINEGQVIAPEAAKDLANATKELVKAWEDGVNARKSRYTSQANVIGIGDAFNNYLSGGSNNGNDYSW